MSGRQAAVIALIVLALSLHVGAREVCSYNPLKYCFNYCCSKHFGSGEECCSSCSRSVWMSTRISSKCTQEIFKFPVAVWIGLGVVGAVIAIGFLIACCLGCICNSLTGRRRYQGRVLRQPGGAVTTVATVCPPQQPVVMQDGAGQSNVGANPVILGHGSFAVSYAPPTDEVGDANPPPLSPSN